MKREIWKLTPSSVKWLYVLSFLMNMGFYALIPYLTLHLTDSFAWTVAMAGLVLAVRQFSQQGFAFLGGITADIFGYKGTMLLGLIVRGAGFLLFAFCTETWQFFAAAVLSGLGGSLFEPACAASYAILTPETIRKEVFAFRNVLTNIGVVGSQIAGTILAGVDFFWLSIFSGTLYFVATLLALVFLPPVQAQNTTGKWSDGIVHVLRDRPFLRYTVILIGFYYLNMQIFLAVPQFTEDVLHSKEAVGIVLATISISIILLQMKVTHWLEGYTRRFTLIGIGALVMGIGLFLLSFADSLWFIMLDAFIFALGTMISVPYLVDMVPRFAPKEHIGAYYGFNGYSLAFGGSIGTFLGGWMYDLGREIGFDWLPWMICLLVGMAVAWNLHQMEEKERNRVNLPGHTA
ncbi:MFS transporter [Brevibacillus humidisoli]|uniref:MDR family MFS transporter n=1 Tax=Brevibacillus humidisoli TaxID=2895522 RepID=UPI001E32A625|nr:MFS transporter [Brevibacillus humidisoli]UFJ42972.1 MFS transporter [Brevibacillus humidisoli]